MSLVPLTTSTARVHAARRRVWQEVTPTLQMACDGVMARKGMYPEDFLFVRLGTISNDVDVSEVQASPAGEDWQLTTEFT